MRLVALIIAVAAMASATSAYQLELSDYWSKFGAIQEMSFCLGKNATEMNRKYVLKFLRECDKVSSTLDPDQPIPSLETANWNKILNRIAPDTKKERIPHLKERLARLIKRFRCTMQRFHITNSDNKIEVSTVVDAYKSLGLPQTLLADLLAGVNQCNELTQCLPQNQPDDSPIPVDVVLTKTFLNCERYMRNWACLKNYLKSDVKAGEFDFSGADGTLDFLPDDDARAAAITLANELVGGDDYGLYE